MATIIIPNITATNSEVQNLAVITTNDQDQTNYSTQTSVQILFDTEVANIASGSGLSYDETTSVISVSGSGVGVQFTINTTALDVGGAPGNPATAQLFDVSDTEAPVAVGAPWTLGGSHTITLETGASTDYAVYAQAPVGQPFAYPARLSGSELAALMLYND